MNYSNIIQWILEYTPIDQDNGIKFYKPGLERIKDFCSYLGNPQKYFKSIHIGGTNGKGSTAHMLSSIFQEEGYNTGLFISPHLIDFRERIIYNGILIEKKFIVHFIEEHKQFIEKKSISFFEMNTALAFQYFKEKKINIAIIEVGLGGRLDSTNIIHPELSVITNVSKDHTEILGEKTIQIAYEKAGIIKNTVPVVIGRIKSKQLKYFFLKEAFKKHSPIYFTDSNEKNIKYKIPFQVDYQSINRDTVINVINIINKKKRFIISNKSIKEGFKNVIKNTSFRGRWHILKEKDPKIICDIAHNEKGFCMINKQLKKEFYKQLHLVLGFVKEKNVKDFFKYLPDKSYIYFCQPNIKRKYPIECLKIIANNFFFNRKTISFHVTVKDAFLYARKKSKKNDLILISGSTFVVSEVLFFHKFE
ncbi:bifunctional folylpolyglutamate synthase/dihydrofolate synthase [Blattabacterium cuenoti]|uniref:bifunctional folylpolyglutamate synthase/dihydrofolate synthase n=1 Tax=Blattabacterium cuenoti TaxID=1653831 RepID=UPI00163B8ED1|nr:Mur ligase family protein [Blattabacterium cuenoti]